MREQLDGDPLRGARAGRWRRCWPAERPDLVGLQEVSRWTRPPTDGGDEQVFVDFLPTLLAALEGAGCGYDAHAVTRASPGRCRSPTAAGSAWCRRERHAGAPRRAGGGGRRDDGAVRRACFDVDTGIEGVTFPVERGWGRVDVRVAGRRLRFVATHTEAYDAQVRDAQRDELLARNGDVDGAVIVVGDLNATPDAVGMPETWTDAWTRGERRRLHVRPGGRPRATRRQTMRERIDYVWVRDADVLSAHVVGDRLDDRTTTEPRLWPSDHAGVVADLEV